MCLHRSPGRWVLRFMVVACGLQFAACRADPAVASVESLSEVSAIRSELLPFQVDRDSSAPIHRILIPPAALAKLAGVVGEVDGVVVVGRSRSIVAALALSASVAFGFVACRRGRAGRRAAGVAGVLAIACVSGLLANGPASADVPPPTEFPRVPSFDPKPRQPEGRKGGDERVVLEAKDSDDEAVVLVVGQTGNAEVLQRRELLSHVQPRLAAATDRYYPISTDATVQKLAEVLEQPVPADAPRLGGEATVDDLRDWMEGTFRLPVRVEQRELEDFGLDVDSVLVNERGNTETLAEMLSQVLDPLGLTLSARADGIVITTREKAEESLSVFIYPPPLSESKTIPDPQPLIDLIQSTIAADSWDVVGGAAAIRPIGNTGHLAISQTLAIHREITDLLRGIDVFGSQEAAADQVRGSGVPLLVYSLGDAEIAVDVAERLVELCNAALGSRGDPAAKVSMIGGRLVVQSASRPFQAYAAELIRSLDGTALEPEAEPGGGKNGMSVFCWVAREVYGPDNPKWLRVRRWMLEEAPAWLRTSYLAHGEAFAGWLKERPMAKAVVRAAFDLAVLRAANAMAMPQEAGRAPHE